MEADCIATACNSRFSRISLAPPGDFHGAWKNNIEQPHVAFSAVFGFSREAHITNAGTGVSRRKQARICTHRWIWLAQGLESGRPFLKFTLGSRSLDVLERIALHGCLGCVRVFGISEAVPRSAWTWPPLGPSATVCARGCQARAPRIDPRRLRKLIDLIARNAHFDEKQRNRCGALRGVDGGAGRWLFRARKRPTTPMRLHQKTSCREDAGAKAMAAQGC